MGCETYEESSMPSAKPRRAKSASARTPREAHIGGISDSAVLKATGRGWDAWLTILDRAGGRGLDHKGLVAVLERQVDSGWWAQMIAVGYEQARGLRKKHETPRGYQVSGSKTVEVPVARLFAAWSSPAQRRTWLADPDFTVRKATANKSLRITWVDGASHLVVNFQDKGARKSQVALGHEKLASAAQAARLKTYWARQLDKLKARLEG
jgi:hypothetical protein